jgi:hypothetical protein
VAGRTATEAVKAFADPIQSALTCFVHGKVVVNSYDPDVEGVLHFNRADDVRLGGRERVYLSVAMRYRIWQPEDPPDQRKPWKVSTTGWAYELKDRDLSPTVQFHWHPAITPDLVYPHLHIPAHEPPRRHFPTGRVLIEDVLNCAVECGAVPADPGKWAEVFRTNVENFGKGATWGNPRS